jgi:hypothetical protein
MSDMQSIAVLIYALESEDVRAVKERDSSSRGASLVGSIPTLRIRVSPHPLQVGPLQFRVSAYQKTQS